MQTRSDLEAETVSRLQLNNNSISIPSTRITEVTKQSNIWAGSLYFWPSLFRSRYFSSKPSSQSASPILPINYDYYDYPTDFLTGSIQRLYIATKKYEKKAYNDFLDYVDNTQQASIPPDPTKRYFAEFGRQFFVYPGVTVAGTNDGLAWGNVQPSDLANPSDKTIFSQWDDAGNEAIVKKNISVLMERLDPVFANAQKTEAIQLLTVMWNKIATENQRSQRLNHARFNSIDMFGHGNGIAQIGNFSGQDIIS